MLESVALKNTVEDILSSYEASIENIASVFDTTHSLLDNLQDSSFTNKEEREKISTHVKDLLAKNQHLRRKDFDNMIWGVLSAQEEQEKEAKVLVKKYFDEQKAASLILKKSLEEFKDLLIRGEVGKVKEIKDRIKETLASQEARKNEVVSKLREFQKEQQEIPKRLKELLTKGEELRIKDFKLMIDKIKSQRQERLELQKKRKQEVAEMLQRFRQAREEVLQSKKVKD